MPPLQRSPTPQSIHSWWSDSNPLGATIPIHTLAKPLSKRLYHRQAIGIIAERRDSPLSKQTVEILTSYLLFKDILPSTRVLVLDHLTQACNAEQEAQVVVEGGALGCTLELLRSSNSDILRSTCLMLESIAHHKTLKTGIIELGLCKEIVSLFSHRNIDVQTAAVQALDSVLKENASEDAVRVVAVDTNALQHVVELLKANPGVLRLEISACSILSAIARFRPFHRALLKQDLCTPLVSLLHRWRPGTTPAAHLQYHAPSTPLIRPSVHDPENEQPNLLRNVIHILASLCQSEEGAWAVVDAKAWSLDSMKLLSFGDLPNYEVTQWTCRMLAYISVHGDSILSYILGHGNFTFRTRVLDFGLETCRLLCSLLRHHSRATGQEAVYTLSCISSSSKEGTQLVVDVLQSFLGGLTSPDYGVVRWTCWMLTEIVEYPALSANVVENNACKQLVRLLSHPDSHVSQDADYALCRIQASSEEAAQSVAVARALQEAISPNNSLELYGFIPLPDELSITTGEVVRVLYEFIPSLPDELSITTGEVVRVLLKDDGGWALCRNGRSVQGMVPLECLSRCTQTLPADRDSRRNSLARLLSV
ncbi:armadillo-type protein [Mycena capillaripes]|nr:armadillo-type protein [Mycena capillaripes]